MKGNFHVRFLGGKAPVRELTYPAIGEHQPDDRDRQPAVRLRQVPVQRADIRPADHPSGKLCYGTQPCNPLPPAGCGQERQQPAGLHHRGLRGHGEQGFADP